MKIQSLFLLLSTCLLFAEVNPGDNILLNGRLEADQADFPVFWSSTRPENVVYNTSDGPGGLPTIRLKGADGETRPETSVRQFSLRLVPGETYKMSAWVKTTGFSCNHYGIIVHNTGWFEEGGIRNVAKDQDWTRMEAQFQAMKSSDGHYGCAIFAVNYQGEFQVADIKLEAISPKALAETPRSATSHEISIPRLVPWTPLLNKIPSHDPKLTFRFFGILKDNDGNISSNYANYILQYTIGNQPPAQIPLQKNLNTLDLAKVPLGDADLKVEIIHKPTGTVELQEQHCITIRELPQEIPANHKKLNNLVTEILNEKTQATQKSYEFTTTRDGWIFVAIKNIDKPTVTLDGKLTIINPDTPRFETFRNLLAGKHTIEIDNPTDGGQVIVRQIAEIFNYCPGANSFVKENTPYDWEFQKKYAHQAVTTQNGGSIPEIHRKWFKESGYYWLANQMSTKLVDDEDLTNRLNNAKALNGDTYDGVTCDEQSFSSVEMLGRYIKGLKAYKNPKDKLIYSWCYGKPVTPGLAHDYIASTVNFTKGKSKLLFEIYCRTRESEQVARDYLDTYAVDTIQKLKEFAPAAMQNTGIIFGNFNQIPILSLQHHPAVDYKYYLDMQLNLVANHPAFEGLGTTGYWGSYYGDHELHRWSFMLLRHYCVEGNTTMLSDQYGLSYIPGHISNGDFEKTLDPWTPQGDVRADSIAQYAHASQNRWGGNNGVGDTFAVFTKTPETTSTLTQIAKNLIPGKTYCFQFVTADYNDIKDKKHNPRQYGITVDLGPNAEIIPELSWIHIDRRSKGRYAHNDGVARTNLNHIVFTAKAPSTPITFSNEKSLDGEQLVLNYVMLVPFIKP
ncbi:MAG: hypothetical protein GX561_04150 [Lentisphaerae bacterium]|jgi:hypothetical protein|nr:hypothetical protein [Lentisphaerota bacterium]